MVVFIITNSFMDIMRYAMYTIFLVHSTYLDKDCYLRVDNCYGQRIKHY